MHISLGMPVCEYMSVLAHLWQREVWIYVNAPVVCVCVLCLCVHAHLKSSRSEYVFFRARRLVVVTLKKGTKLSFKLQNTAKDCRNRLKSARETWIEERCSKIGEGMAWGDNRKSFDLLNTLTNDHKNISIITLIPVNSSLWESVFLFVMRSAVVFLCCKTFLSPPELRTNVWNNTIETVREDICRM